MPELIALAKNVRRIRTNMKLSQLQFSMKSGISLELLSMIEREKTNPRLSTLQKLAAYIGCTVADLLRIEDENNDSENK